MNKFPNYNDGVLHLFKIETDEVNDFPTETLIDLEMRIWFTELSIFDRTRYELGQGGIKLTKKIRIPMYKKITTKHIVKIDDVYHSIFNVANLTNTNGFKETELTLIEYEDNN
jgi:SPP1 family predicted phage head-tail adaptor